MQCARICLHACCGHHHARRAAFKTHDMTRRYCKAMLRIIYAPMCEWYAMHAVYCCLTW